MPIYTYHCEECHEEQTAIRKIADRESGPYCCGVQAPMRITACAFVPPDWNFQGYKCVATGKTITSERERHKVMEENGLADAREFPAPDFDQMKEDREAFHQVAEEPVPQDLQDAIKREGLDSIV